MADNKFKVVGLSNLKTFYEQLKEKFALKVDGNKKVLYTNTNNDPIAYTKAEIDAKLGSIGGGTGTGENPLLFINTDGNTNNIFDTIQNNMNSKIVKRRIGDTDEVMELFDAIFLSPNQVIFSRFYPQQAREHDDKNSEWNPNTYNLGNLSTLNKNNTGDPTWDFSTIEVVNAQDIIDKIKELDTKITTLETNTSKEKIEEIIKNYKSNNSKS